MVHLSSRAEVARPLSLPPRCAFVVTNAQRAPAQPRWHIGNAVFILQNRYFDPPRRCAFVTRNAQRAPARAALVTGRGYEDVFVAFPPGARWPPACALDALATVVWLA
jgi:hypothetical protein